MKFLDLLYPPYCLHCKNVLEAHAPFCAGCLTLIQLLPKEGRCSKCAAEISTPTGVCPPCRLKSHPYRALHACFESYSPARSLLRAFHTSHNFHLIKDIAAYCVIQLHHLQLPSFQFITMIPNHFRQPHFAIGKEVAKMLNLPFRPVLHRHWAPQPSFSLKKRCNIINQRVLFLDVSLVQDIDLIRTAAFALDAGLPEVIYGMTFCTRFGSG